MPYYYPSPLPIHAKSTYYYLLPPQTTYPLLIYLLLSTAPPTTYLLIHTIWAAKPFFSLSNGMKLTLNLRIPLCL